MLNVRNRVVKASLIWTGQEFQESLQIRVDSQGTITEIGKSVATPSDDVIDLGNKALLPGFINAHSHAFHRQMRGRSKIGVSAEESFWKWRNDMYSLVDDIDYEKLYKYSLGTFKEMLSAGITSVGEFHYIHHQRTDRFELDKAILDAAKDAGIRLVLIDALYYRGGFDNRPLTNAQQRFLCRFEEFIESVKTLENYMHSNDTNHLQRIAVAAHSLRAVSIDDCKRLSEWGVQTNRPIHIHMEEQPQEVNDCQDINKCKPSDLLLDYMVPTNANITAVHCSFTTLDNMKALARTSVNVCICPLTEGYLGDGIPEIADNSKVCIGTDCNNRISILEELRLLTYSQHTKRNCRSVFGFNAEKLLRISTINGAESLGIDDITGELKVGKQLDFVAFNLDSQRLQVPAVNLLDAIIFGSGNEDISDVAVSGMIHHSV